MEKGSVRRLTFLVGDGIALHPVTLPVPYEDLGAQDKIFPFPKGLMGDFVTMQREHRMSLNIVNIFLFFLLPLFVAAPAPAANRNLVLFPFTLYAEHPEDYLRQGLRTMFLSRLSGGGLDVITGEALDPLLSENEKKGAVSRERAEEIARQLKADYAVFGSLTSLGGGSSLDLSFLDLTKNPSKLTHVSEATTVDQFIPRVADVANRFRAIIEGRFAGPRTLIAGGQTTTAQGPAGGIFARIGQSDTTADQGGFFKPAKEYGGFQPTGMLPLSLTVVSFCSADLTGDGNRELLVLGKSELRVYQKKGERYSLRDTYRASTGEIFLKVSAGDVDGDGRPEIYLVSFYGRSGQSTVLEWNGKFRKRFQERGHLHAVTDSGSGKSMLLYVNSRLNDLFVGDISIMGYNASGKLQKIKSLPELKKARFYTLIPYDLNKNGTPEFIGLGDGDRLYAWSTDGDVLWKGDEEIGGTNNTVQIGRFVGGEKSPWVSVNSRLVVTDIDGDGKKEVIAVKNIPLVKFVENMKLYVKAQLAAYRIDGATLTKGWTSRTIPYCVTDMDAADGTLFIAAQEGRLSTIGEGKSRILWFTF